MADTATVEVVDKKQLSTQVNQAVTEIRTAYENAQNAYLNFCRLIHAYKAQAIWSSIREALIEQEVFGDSTLKKLEAIGGSKQLLAFKDVGQLPEGYNTLYYISQIKKENWDKAVKEIRSTMTIAEARLLAERYGEKKKQTSSQKSKAKRSSSVTRTIYYEVVNEKGNLGRIKELEQEMRMKLKKIDPNLHWQVE